MAASHLWRDTNALRTTLSRPVVEARQHACHRRGRASEHHHLRVPVWRPERHPEPGRLSCRLQKTAALIVGSSSAQFIAHRGTTMSRHEIKLPGGEVAISSSKDARYLEERDGEVLALMIAGHCFSWWSNDQLR